MDVLAYLVADPLVVPSESGPEETKCILFGHCRVEEGDEDLLRWFSSILLGLERGETFNALREKLPFEWCESQYYDIVNPFGDKRQIQYHALWTFDTEKDLLHHINATHHSQVPLSLLRNRAVSMADMEDLGGPVPAPSSLDAEWSPARPYWKPSLEIDDRLRAFIHRLLRDFHHQWRHILRNDYNLTTSRLLARAIIRLSTLDFEIRENTGGTHERGVHVWITQLPSWAPMNSDIERCGNAHIVLCRDMQEGLAIARRHLASGIPSTAQRQNVRHHTESPADYVILSIKHIMLCRTASSTLLEHSTPEPLFNGDCGSGSPSERALDYLVWATMSARPLFVTPLQTLPVEIQDLILNHVSIGTVEAAKIGCLFGVGIPFTWKDDLRNVELTDRHYVRPPGLPVESQLWFDAHKSGIVYLAR